MERERTGEIGSREMGWELLVLSTLVRVQNSTDEYVPSKDRIAGRISGHLGVGCDGLGVLFSIGNSPIGSKLHPGISTWHWYITVQHSSAWYLSL